MGEFVEYVPADQHRGTVAALEHLEAQACANLDAEQGKVHALREAIHVARDALFNDDAARAEYVLRDALNQSGGGRP